MEAGIACNVFNNRTPFSPEGKPGFKGFEDIFMHEVEPKEEEIECVVFTTFIVNVKPLLTFLFD